MAVTNATQKGKTVADPTAAYDSIRPLWTKSRAVCNGERFVKEYDGYLDNVNFQNLLLPFSPSMTEQQYKFYKSEAELPGVVAQYARIIVGGLLRKQPQLILPDGAPEDAYQWIMDAFAQDSAPLLSFLDNALWEELQTSRAWVYVDYPQVSDVANKTTEDFRDMKPYPVLWNAESVVNWRMGTMPGETLQKLIMVIVRNYELEYSGEGFHPQYKDTVWVHELKEGKYQIRKFQKDITEAQIAVVNGKIQQQYTTGGQSASAEFKLIDTLTNILANGERLTVIPAWPLNGSIEPVEPILTPLIDKEISLYNKMSRRNHLLYGAATYTPVIMSDMTDEKFDDVVNAGLGSWIHLRQGDQASVLETPTAALMDMDRSIASAIEEMAKLGIRMLSPEAAESGVALEIRNAAQTAQLGTLNVKISNQLADIIAFMLNWRYDLEYTSEDVEFTLSADFNPVPLGADWLRLVTEWYQSGLIPRSLWLQILKQNDLMPPDYDDEEAQDEINADELVATPKDQMDFAQKMQEQQMALDTTAATTAAPLSSVTKKSTSKSKVKG